jgi:hypothetical protein
VRPSTLKSDESVTKPTRYREVVLTSSQSDLILRP